MEKHPILINPILSPCKDCEKRADGCHSKCQDYATFKHEINVAKNKKFRSFESEDAWSSKSTIEKINTKWRKKNE